VTHWPKEDYGKFFNGDSYIILRTYKKPNTDVSSCNILLRLRKKSIETDIDKECEQSGGSIPNSATVFPLLASPGAGCSNVN
jgi:vacuolar-type H+-ATPase subunit C/Vma6